MSSRARSKGIYRFLGFSLDTSTLELRDAAGALPPLPRQAFDLLLHLIEHRDRVVTKDELFDALWSNVATTDNSLSQAVWAVRRAIGDTGGAQRVIKNLRGRGYRFVADVQHEDPEAIASRAVARSAPAVATAAAQANEGMIGRDAELAQLVRALDDARRGSGRTALVSGGPGIGKTRLCAELRARVESEGGRVYEGRCLENEGMPPFWPLQQIARGLARDLSSDELRELVGDVAGDLVRLIPELREAIEVLSHAPEREHSQDRFQMFDALSELFTRAAVRCAPLVMIVDDLHWADESTLLALSFLAPTIARTPLLLVIAHRDDPAREPLRRCIGTLARQGDTVLVALTALEEAQTARLMEQRGASASDGALVRRVHELTAGNPFMVVQVARWLAQQPAAAVTGATTLALPPQARSLVEQQLAQLPPSCQELLRIGAVLGQTFHLGDLRRASSLDTEAVLELLEAALLARLIRADGAGSYTFGHPTICSTIVEALPRSTRVALHKQIALSLAETSGEDDGGRATELAHHFYEAAAAGCQAQAIHYCRLAAERAYDATAFEEAVCHFQRALAVLELTDAPDERLRCTLLLGMGRSLRGTPEPVSAIKAVFAEAARRARSIDDSALLCEAAMCHAGRGPRRVGALNEAGTVALADIELLETALRRLGPEPSANRALVEAWLAHALYHSDRCGERRALASHSVEVARSVGDDAVLAECLMLHQASVRGPSDLPDRLLALDEIIELAKRAQLRGLLLDAHDERAFARIEVGELDSAELDVQSVVRLVDELRRPHEKRPLVLHRMMRLDGEGRFDEALATFHQAQAAAPWRRSGDRLDQGAAIRDSMVLLFRNKSHEMIPLLEAFSEKFPLPVAWHCGLVSSYALAGRPADARRELDRLAVADFACIPDDHNWIVSHGLLANACRIIDDPRHAGVLYARLSKYPDYTMFLGLHGFCAGPVQRALGELCLVQGDFEPAEQHFVVALERANRSGMLIWSAWIRLLMAELGLRARRPGDDERAFEQVAHASNFARERRLDFLIEWVERLRKSPRARTAISRA